MIKFKQITVFEHESLCLNESQGRTSLEPSTLKSLQEFHEQNKRKKYFELINNGVKFNEHVGILQIGDTLIEILPKLGSAAGERQTSKIEFWRGVLIDMILYVNFLGVSAPTKSTLNLKPNSLLDLYFIIYIQELEYIIRRGLIKKYRNREDNLYTLKGSLVFSKHISKNIVHKERFYVRHSHYDVEHLIHLILYKALLLIKRINPYPELQGRISNLLLDFPELSDIQVDERLFERIQMDRKSNAYKNALEIARLLLLKYHPDLTAGKSDVLALLFDMNDLWENFVLKTLQNKLSSPDQEIVTKGKESRSFYLPAKNERYFSNSRSIQPDIFIQTHAKVSSDNENQKSSCIYILDTKWKNLSNANVSASDLRQMFVYMEYFGAKKVGLVYPEPMFDGQDMTGYFLSSQNYNQDDRECSVLCWGIPDLEVMKSPGPLSIWQDAILSRARDWLEESNFKT